MFILPADRQRFKRKDANDAEPAGHVPSEVGDENAPGTSKFDVNSASSGCQSAKEQQNEPVDRKSSIGNGIATPGAKKTARADDPFEQSEREDMERLLGELRGHLGKYYFSPSHEYCSISLVMYPTRFLEGEDIANNFLFNADRLLPLPIYN